MSKPLPVWLLTLRWVCKSQGMDVVARKLGVHVTYVRLVLSGRFRGDTEPIARAVLKQWAGIFEGHEDYLERRFQYFEEKRLGHV